MINMNCKEFQHHLFAQDEGELSHEVLNAMDRHTMGCESCSKLQSGIQAVDRAILAEKALEPVPFFTTRFIQRLENERAEKAKPAYRILQPAIITFFLAAALFTGFLVGNQGAARKSQVVSGPDQIELLKTELYVVDFVEEDNTLLTNY
jgi:hypothetical protein